jgi:hypothetical protein
MSLENILKVSFNWNIKRSFSVEIVATWEASRFAMGVSADALVIESYIGTLFSLWKDPPCQNIFEIAEDGPIRSMKVATWNKLVSAAAGASSTRNNGTWEYLDSARTKTVVANNALQHLNSPSL